MVRFTDAKKKRILKAARAWLQAWQDECADGSSKPVRQARNKLEIEIIKGWARWDVDEWAEVQYKNDQ